MKKVVSIIGFFLIMFFSLFSINVYAASLNNIEITLNKTTVEPNNEVKVDIDFGTNLGSYTVDIAYDKNLFEYVSSEGGTVDDNGIRVRVYFYDTTGGTSPRNNMSVIFKAKSEIITSNPTDFSITLEGLANEDATIAYDDITIPIVKNIIVEPKYEDYVFAFDYTGNVIVNEEKDIKITLSSALGKNYEHTRIVASVVAPTGGTAKLFATDSASLEHDIIQSGWGDASGTSVGGKDVKKVLNTRGVFTAPGNYEITISLIDRDNSDAIITSGKFNIAVKEKEDTNPDINTNINSNPNNSNSNTNSNLSSSSKPEEMPKTPQKLPQTGTTIYFAIIFSIGILVICYVMLKPKK